MRLGVLDVGSNTVRLVVVDAYRGGHPTPMHSEKDELRLAEAITRDGALSNSGEQRLVAAIDKARTAAAKLSCDDLIAFATSAVRDATNSAEVLARIRTATEVDLQVLSGEDEVRFTFLAVRRWMGWSAGRLLTLDIGSGSLEIGHGLDESPEVALSLPLGAGRLTRERLVGDPPTKARIAKLKEHVDDTISESLSAVGGMDKADKVVATSKIFRSLARLTGAAPYAEGPRVRRYLRLPALRQLISFVSYMASDDLATLEGVSAARAHQLLAGGIVAESTMRHLGCERVEICPWALREGLILRRLDWLDGA